MTIVSQGHLHWPRSLCSCLESWQEFSLSVLQHEQTPSFNALWPARVWSNGDTLCRRSLDVSSIRFVVPISFNVLSFHWPISFDQMIPEAEVSKKNAKQRINSVLQSNPFHPSNLHSCARQTSKEEHWFAALIVACWSPRWTIHCMPTMRTYTLLDTTYLVLHFSGHWSLVSSSLRHLVSWLFKLPSTVQMHLVSGCCTTCGRKWCGSRQTSEAPSGSIGTLFSRGDATCCSQVISK